MRKKDNVTKLDSGTKPADHNGIDNEALKGFIERSENVEAKIETILAEAQEKCQPHRDDLKVIKNEASDAGFAKKSYSATLRHRKLIRKADEVRTKLNDDQQNSYDLMLHALGDLAQTPLGQAALN